MIIGVPKEVKKQEYRVALTPGGARQLIKRGHRVVVETLAGAAVGFPDEAYTDAGAKILATHAEVFGTADMIVKVKELVQEEHNMQRPGQILFAYLHLAVEEAMTHSMLERDIVGLAYESLLLNGRRPLLEPMSEIAGRMSVLMGAYFLGKAHSSTATEAAGVLLSGVPGVLPARVAVLGGGTAGVNAARIAQGLGAEVVILDIDVERLRHIDNTMPGIRTLYSSAAHLEEILPGTDLLIGAVLIPGARAPKLVSRSMLRLMKPGRVFVDIAVDQGGCAETSRPMTHADPVYIEEGIVHYCVANMPGAYARTATQALTNATFPYVQRIADGGLSDFGETCRMFPELVSALYTYQGRITNEAIAHAHGLKYEPWHASTGKE
ncbi:MAG: alanine dehydrogenase [Candidatus Methylacidiphilales bacterium]|nr:alanine dehydrogenase [Candidatus Methylacidiphilales bacterium]